MACTGNADSAFWQAVKVFSDCNVPSCTDSNSRIKEGLRAGLSDSTIPKFDSRKTVHALLRNAQ